MYVYTHIRIYLFRFSNAGGSFGNENSECSYYRMSHRTPQNHMTTNPNKLWRSAKVAVKFDSQLGQLTASSRYNFAHD